MGNESSESMREMCGCVSFSVRAKAQVYASRSSWNAQEPEETPHRSKPILLPLTSLPTVLISLLLFLLPFICGDSALSPSFSPLKAGLLDRNKRKMCLFMWLRMNQGKALAEKRLRTMKVGLEPSQGRSNEKNPCQESKVCKRLTHMLLYCTGRNFGITYLCHIRNDYT